MEREEWDRRYDQADLVWTASANRFLVDEVEGLRPGRALDMACGEGRNAVWLAERGWDVTGVDFSDVGLAKARRLAEARGVEVRWECADLRTYQPEHDAYDLVAILYLHLPPAERRRLHAAAAGALRAGGVVLVVGHHLANLEGGYGGPQDPSVLFTADDVTGELAGLTIERAAQVERPVVTEDGERIALDALVRAVRR